MLFTNLGRSHLARSVLINGDFLIFHNRVIEFFNDFAGSVNRDKLDFDLLLFKLHVTVFNLI